MKAILSALLALVLLLGCGKAKQPTNTNHDNNTKAKPAKELTKEEVVGSYELESDGNTLRVVFLEDGIREFCLNGGKVIDAKWKIVDREIHEEGNGGMNGIYRINKCGSINIIADIGAQGWGDGKRIEYPTQNQFTYKKIK